MQYTNTVCTSFYEMIKVNNNLNANSVGTLPKR